MAIIFWFVIWFLIWTVFNVRFNWKKAKTKNDKYYVTSGFFFICSAIVFLTFRSFFAGNGIYLAAGFIFSVFIGIFFSDYHPYYKHIKNGRYFLIALAFDILMQQILIVVGLKFLTQYFGVDYKNFYFGIMLVLGHLPVVFLKWAKLRYLYLVLTFFGGTLFSYLINRYLGIGITASILIHYTLYVPIFYYLRDERKI